MYNKLMSLGVLFFLLSIPSNSQTVSQKPLEDQTYFNGDKLLEHIKILSSDDFEGRRTGTKGAIKAKQYIVDQFKKLNVLPLDETFEQDFSFTSRGKYIMAQMY